MKDLLLLTGIVAFAVGVSFSTFVSVPPATILFLALLSIGFFFTWFFGKRDWYLFPMLVLLGIAIGIARVELIRDTLQTSFVPLIDTKVSLEGTVVADPDVRESTQRLVVRTHSGSEDSRVLVVAPRYPAYHHGDVLTIRGKLTYPQAFETDGGRTFAYDSFLAKDGIFSMMKFAQVEKTGESGNLLVRIQKSLSDVKHAFAKGLENALPEPHASLAGGLLVGGKQGIGKALLEDFTIAGLLPIIVLSGYNVMIVAQGILIGFSFLRKRTALTLAVVTIALFVLSAGGGSSAIRAGLMAGLALFARATGRTYDALRILLFVFVLMLLWNPLQLVYDPGFQFSFAATAGLILLSPLLELPASLPCRR